MGCKQSNAKRYRYEEPRPHTEFFSHQFLKQKYAARLKHNTIDKHSGIKHVSMYLAQTGNTDNTFKIKSPKSGPSSSSVYVHNIQPEEPPQNSAVHSVQKVTSMEKEIEILKMNNKITLEKLENIMNKLNVSDESGLASSMIFSQGKELDHEEYDMGQPMDDEALKEFTLSKDQIKEHKWNHIEIKEKYNFDLTRPGGEDKDLL